jgi:hypothetical protein
VLTKTRALANFAFGIVTAFGATDGGGNVAHDNAGVAECGPPIACD